MQRLPVIGPTSCDGCGACCLGIGSPVLLYASPPGSASRPDGEFRHPFRPEQLPRELIEEIDDHFSGLLRGQEPQAQCLWYDLATRQCRHYEFRPQICRDYELGSRACLALRRELGLPVHSPGLDLANLD